MVYRHHLFFAITIDRSCLTIAIIFDNKARSWLEVFRTLPNLISEFPSTLLPLGRRHEFPRNWVWQFVVVRIEIFSRKSLNAFLLKKTAFFRPHTYWSRFRNMISRQKGGWVAYATFFTAFLPLKSNIKNIFIGLYFYLSGNNKNIFTKSCFIVIMAKSQIKIVVFFYQYVYSWFLCGYL